MKEIQLGGHRKGSEIKGYAIVDDIDFDSLNQWKWHKNNQGYVTRSYKGIRMHRIIMKVKKGQQIDHINLNKLDNRKQNLRFCDYSQNRVNRKKTKNKTSLFKGVAWNREWNKWMVQVYWKGRRSYLGGYTEEHDAAMAYDKAAKILHGKYALLNFPK